MATADQTQTDRREMDPNDRMELTWSLAELMGDYEDKGYAPETVKKAVVGYAEGRMSGNEQR